LAPSAPTIHGTWLPRYARVVDAFRDNFIRREELGAGFTLVQDGEVVVDLWAGTADEATSRPWAQDTPVVVFSTTKGMVALAFLMLQDRGQLDLDAPVDRWWPELGRGGKHVITVRMLLNHRSGLSAVDTPLHLADFADPDKVDPILAAQRPLWAPGEHQGYGATAWGMYTGALFRRITGETVGTFLAREIFESLGVDAWLGLPDAVLPRLATLYPKSPAELARTALPEIARGTTLEGRVYRRFLLERRSDTARALRNPVLSRAGLKVLNDPALLRIEMPWMNMVATSRAIATVYGALAAGGAPLVSSEAVASVAQRQSWAWEDRILTKPIGFAQGFVKEEPHLFSPNEASFGHPGVGGSLGMADPRHGLGFGYVLNRMDPHIRSPRALALCHAVYRSLGYG
jgi:CubicO group peptidase (beta-lactamase class C family)